MLNTHSEAASALVDACPSPEGVMFSGTGRGFFGAMTDYYFLFFFFYSIHQEIQRQRITTGAISPKMPQYINKLVVEKV